MKCCGVEDRERDGRTWDGVEKCLRVTCSVMADEWCCVQAWTGLSSRNDADCNETTTRIGSL